MTITMTSSVSTTATTVQSNGYNSIVDKTTGFTDSTLHITAVNNSVIDSTLQYLDTTKTIMDYTETPFWNDGYFLNKTDLNVDLEESVLSLLQNNSSENDTLNSELKITIFTELNTENNVSTFSRMDQFSMWNTSGFDQGGNGLFNVTVEEYLEDLNRDFAHRVLAAVVVLAVLMVLGVVGNIFVLFVYTCRAKRGTVTRFIQALAVFDLLSCCVAIPGEIIDMTNNYTFGRDPLCKVVRTVNLFCTIASGATLVVVAIDRYKRICCPLRRQISPRAAVIIAFVCAIISLVISLPTATLYGSRTVSTDLHFVNGTDCSINDQFVNTMFPIAYNGLQLLLFVVGAVTLTVLYILIGSKVCRHVHQQVMRRKSFSLGRSKFSPANPSECSFYSTNMDIACRVRSDLSSPLDDPTESDARVKITDTKQEVLFNVGSTFTTSVKEKCLKHNNNKEDFKVIPCITAEYKHPLINGTKHQENETGKTENITDIVENSCCHSSRDETIDKYSLLIDTSASNKSGSMVEANQTRTLMKSLQSKEIHGSQGSKEAIARIDESSVKFAALEYFPQSVSFIVSSSENVPLTNSKSETQLHQSNIAASINTLVSVATAMSSQRQSFHQSLQELPSQNIGSAPLINCNMKHIHSDKTNAMNSTRNNSTHSDDNSCTTSPPTTPLEKQDNPARALLQAHSTEPNRGDFKASGFRTQNTSSDLSNHKRNKTKSSLLNQFTSDHSHTGSKLHKNGSFLTKTQLHPTATNGQSLKPRSERKQRGSLRLRQYLSFGYFGDVSEAPSQKLLNRSIVETDGQVERQRMDEKEKMADTTYKNGTRRTTLMLFLITIVYILSFLPHLVLMTVKALDEDSLAGHGASWELAQNLLIRSYFINSMANPIIYSFFSKNFFRDCKNSLNCCRENMGRNLSI